MAPGAVRAAALAPALLAALAPGLTAAAPVRYPLDPEATELVALTRPAGLLRGVSHPHLVVARHPSGEVVYDAEDPERATVEVRLPADGLENDDPALRGKYGLEGVLDAADRRKVAEALRAPGQLDAGAHPFIAFASRAVRRLEGGRLEIRGLPSIRGVSAEIALPVKVAVDGGVLRGEGTVEITHAMFGFRPFSTALGAIRNAEEIVLRLTLVGRARPGGAAPDAP
jgi:polyisoprenoid-binding protein YceI